MERERKERRKKHEQEDLSVPEVRGGTWGASGQSGILMEAQCVDALLSLLGHILVYSSTYLLTPVYETGTVLGAEDEVINRFLLWWGLYCSWEICTINKINVQVMWYIRKCYGEIHSEGDRWEPRGKICNFK